MFEFKATYLFVSDYSRLHPCAMRSCSQRATTALVEGTDRTIEHYCTRHAEPALTARQQWGAQNRAELGVG